MDGINSASSNAGDVDANDKNAKGEPNERGAAGAGAGRPRKEKGQKMSEFPLYILMHNQDALDKVKRARAVRGTVCVCVGENSAAEGCP